MNHSTTKRLASLLIACLLLLSLTGCGEDVGEYRILKTVGEERFSIGYRVGDPKNCRLEGCWAWWYQRLPCLRAKSRGQQQLPEG